MRPCAIAMFDSAVIIQDIFKLFFIQLRLLRDNDENFQKRFTLLETLATLKMPLLLVEICRAEDSRDHDDAPLIDMFNTLLEIALYVLPAMFVVLFSAFVWMCVVGSHDLRRPHDSAASTDTFVIDIIASVLMEMDDISPPLLDALLRRLLPVEKVCHCALTAARRLASCANFSL